MNRLYYIYKLTFPNGKIYVGQTVDLSRRFLSYRKLHCKNQIKLYETLKFYDWDLIKIEILYTNISNQATIDEKEEFYISCIPEELKLNIKESVNSFIALKGSANKLSKPIYQIDKDFNIVKEWGCISELQERFQKNSANISKVINEKTFFAYGFYWCHKKDYTPDFKPERKVVVKKKIKIVQLTKKGVFIKIFDSLDDCAKEVNGLVSNIYVVCKQRKSSAYGFIWAFYEDYLKPEFKIRDNLRKSKKVSMYNLDNIFIKTFNSMTEACLETGLSRATILRSCNNKVKKPYRYIFKYDK